MGKYAYYLLIETRASLEVHYQNLYAEAAQADSTEATELVVEYRRLDDELDKRIKAHPLHNRI